MKTLFLLLTMMLSTACYSDEALSGRWTDYYNEGDSFRSDLNGVTVTAIAPNQKYGAYLRTGLLKWDASNSAVRFKIKVSDWDKASIISLLIGNGATFENAGTIDLKSKTYGAPNDQWIEMSIPLSAATIEGTVNWKSVDSALIQVASLSDKLSVSIKDVEIIKNQSTSGILSITVDDGLADTLIAELELLRLRVSATAFIDHTMIGQPGYLTQAEVNRLKANGWDIGGHRIGRLTQLTSQGLSEFLNSQSESLNLQNADIRLFALPNGAYSQEAMSELKKHYNYVFSISGYNNITNALSPFYINRQSIDKHTSLNQAKSWIDAAVENNEWVIINFHTFSDIWEKEEDWSTADFIDLIKYAKSKKIQIKTISQTIRDSQK